MSKEKLSVNLDEVPVSELTLKGMTWSSDDRQFFKRAIDANNEKIKRHIDKQLSKEFDRIGLQISKALLARDRLMFEKMDEQTLLMKDFRTELQAVKTDQGHLRSDVTGIRQQMRSMGEDYKTMDNRLRKIERRERMALIILRLAVTAIITAALTVIIVRVLHDQFWSVPLLSLFTNQM